jgi:1,4-dihydroxy-6-naphthoate synthase
MTTAFLALKLFEPDFEHVVTPFDQILDAVKNQKADAGLIIHEGQLTYGHDGLHSVVDLGKWFKAKYQLPLPLGANAMRRNLPPEVQSECSKLVRDSIQYSLDHRDEALNYAMQFARDMDPALADQFVGMYVIITRPMGATLCRARRRSCWISAMRLD